MIKNILLDLDDTILDFRVSEKRALTDTLIALHQNPCAEILERYSVINKAHWVLFERGEITRQELKILRYQQLFEEFHISIAPEQANELYELRLSEGHDMIPGAYEFLQQLAENYSLYLVTNGTAKTQKKRVELAKIMPFFDDLFISEEVGYSKPDVRFFEYCFHRIKNFTKEETVIIGDTLTSDILGGKNCGIKTIWYHADGEVNAAGIVPDYEVTSYKDALAVIYSEK